MGRTQSLLARHAALVGVTVPIVICTLIATKIIPSFDGAMNLQVAASLADGGGFTRSYSGGVPFPSEIQTSGLFIYLEAAMIRLFGASTFVFEIANLAFVALLAAAIGIPLRRRPVAALLAPSLVIFSVPGMLGLALTGFGEYAIAGLAIAAFRAIASVASGASRRPYVRLGVAWALCAVAITIKIVALLIVPVICLAMIALRVGRLRMDLRKGLTAMLAGVVPVFGVFEIVRLVSIGSWSGYLTYWHYQLEKTAWQAGVTGTGETGGSDILSILAKGARHLSVMALHGDITRLTLMILLVIPLVILVGLFVTRAGPWREWLSRSEHLFACMTAAYAYAYMTWWVFMTPTEKAWIRRIVIGLVCLAVLYVSEGIAISGRFHRVMKQGGWASVGGASRTVIVGGALGLVFGAGLIAPQAEAEFRHEILSNQQELSGLVRVSTEVRALAANGARFYGLGWWSAPVVSLYADVPFEDLEVISDVCDPNRGLASGDAYIVWDRLARDFAVPSRPKRDGLLFERVSEKDNSHADVWRISTVDGLCPPGD